MQRVRLLHAALEGDQILDSVHRQGLARLALLAAAAAVTVVAPLALRAVVAPAAQLVAALLLAAAAVELAIEIVAAAALTAAAMAVGCGWLVAQRVDLQLLRLELAQNVAAQLQRAAGREWEPERA